MSTTRRKAHTTDTSHTLLRKISLMTHAQASTADRILDAALPLMLQEGYHGVSVDSIISRSGISKGSFFYHFKSKEVLAERLLTRFFEEKGRTIRSLMAEIEAENLAPLATLLKFVDHLPQRYRNEQCNPGCLMAAFSYQLINEMPTLRTYCQDIMSGWSSYFQPYFKRALHCDDTLADELARMMFCQLEGAFVVERIEGHHELDTQFRHFGHYLRLLSEQQSRNAN